MNKATQRGGGMGVMDFFFGNRSERQSGTPPAAIPQQQVRPELLAAVTAGVRGILQVQLERLEMEWGWVPLDEDDRGRRSCGYVLGLVRGVLDQFAQLAPSQAEYAQAIASGFASVHGHTDDTAAPFAIYLYQAEEQHVCEGVALALRDVEAVYSGEAWAAPNGFFVIHDGNPAALEYALSTLQRDWMRED